MKTSFYFVIWIIIYPLLGLLNNQFVNDNNFIIALILVFALSYFINRAIPNVISYARRTSAYPMLENAFMGNVHGFLNKLSAQTTMSVITAIYFIVATVAIIITFLNDFEDWFAVLLFAYFSYNAMKRSVGFSRIRSLLTQNPTPEQCVAIAQNNLRLNYESYYEARQYKSYQEMFQPRPKGFMIYMIVSIIFATISALLGLATIIMSIITFGGGHTFASTAMAGMLLLYGSLATYYGIFDFIDCIRIFRNSK